MGLSHFPRVVVDLYTKIEASMCHLRGLLMLKLNRGDQAKNCFMEALALDVKCFDAFEQLISGEMMAPDEGQSYAYLIISSLLMSVQNGNSCRPWHTANKPLRTASSCG